MTDTGSIIILGAIVFVLLLILMALLVLAWRPLARSEVAVREIDLPPAEVYRCGRYFVIRRQPYWWVCEDSGDPTNPYLVRECAAGMTAVRFAQKMHEREMVRRN